MSPNRQHGDCNLGLTFGKPVITKLAGQWVVMFTSGYNNVNGAATGDGVGFLYVLDARTGAIIHKIATTAGTAGTPSGLAQINNFVDNGLIDNTTLRVYGGDVLGNMWRFDFLPGATATLLGTAKDHRQRDRADHGASGARRARRQALRDVRHRQAARRRATSPTARSNRSTGFAIH